jgi:hypothetical protein
MKFPKGRVFPLLTWSMKQELRFPVKGGLSEKFFLHLSEKSFCPLIGNLVPLEKNVLNRRGNFDTLVFLGNLRLLLYGRQKGERSPQKRASLSLLSFLQCLDLGLDLATRSLVKKYSGTYKLLKDRLAK